MIDIVAKELNIDPFKFRRLNFVHKGDMTCTGGIYHDDIKLEEMLDSILNDPRFIKLQKTLKENNEYYVGIGMANVSQGTGFGGIGDQFCDLRVKLEKNKDSFDLYIANVDMGQNIQEAYKIIISETLNINKEQITVHNYQTFNTFDSRGYCSFKKCSYNG